MQVLNIQTGELMADFQYDVTEAVTDNPRIVCLIVQGLKGGVYYFNSQDVCSPRFIYSILLKVHDRLLKFPRFWRQTSETREFETMENWRS